MPTYSVQQLTRPSFVSNVGPTSPSAFNVHADLGVNHPVSFIVYGVPSIASTPNVIVQRKNSDGTWSTLTGV